MRCDLLRVAIRNFKSYRGGWHKVDFAAIGQGFHMVKGRNLVDPQLGSNGSGKSSLFDSISWCWFGRTTDNEKGPDIKPWQGEGKTTVVTQIEMKDGRHSVVRTTNPNRLLFDEQVISQVDLEGKLGFDFEVFHHTIVFGQGRPLFFDLEPRKKMELFVSTLQLDRWDQWSEDASTRAAALQRQLDTLKGEVPALEHEAESIDELLHRARDASAQWEAGRAARQKLLRKTLAEVEKRRKTVEKRRDEADLALESAGLELRPLREQIAQLEDDLRQKEADHRAHQAVARDRLQQAKAELSELGDSDRCPRCGQSLRGTALERHREELQEEVVNARAGLGPEPGEIGKARATLVRLRQAYEKFDQKADKAQSELDLYRPEARELQTRANAANAQLEDMQREGNPHHEQVRDLRARQTNINRDLKLAKEEILAVEAEWRRTKFWVKGFKEVRLYIVDQLLAELEITTNAILADVGMSGWEIQYDVEKETKKGTIQRGLTVTILSPDNERPVKWESWSGGEGQRLRLVGALALSEVLLSYAGVSPSFQVLDEPTAHLSTEGIVDLCELLNDWAAGTGRAVFFIDHHAVDSIRFGSVLTVLKDERGSHLVEA